MSTHQSSWQLGKLADQASEHVGALAQRGMDSVRDTSQQLRHKAHQAGDDTLDYIKDEPVKAILIAAAAGALLMTLISLISRSRDRY